MAAASTKKRKPHPGWNKKMAIKVAKGTKVVKKAVRGGYISDKEMMPPQTITTPVEVHFDVHTPKGKMLTKKQLRALHGFLKEPGVLAPTSKATSNNPKNILGTTRVDVTLVPPISLLHCADAMMDGADKYDPYNWRAKEIAIRGYIAAIFRHALAYMEGEDLASDSMVKHLGHIMASAAILIDATAHGCIIDDRLNKDLGQAFNKARAQVEANVKMRREKRAK